MHVPQHTSNCQYLVNVVNNVGLCDAEYVIVSFEILVVLGEVRAPKVLLFQLLLLDHCSHAAVEHHDPLLQSHQNLRRHV